jgi:hypothetical protein
MELTDDQMDKGFDWATKLALSKTAEHMTTLATGNPLAGRVAGKATGAAYNHIPDPVKGGAALGGVIAVNGAAPPFRC